MERRRVKSVVVEPWGRATLYTDVGASDVPQTILKEASSLNKDTMNKESSQQHLTTSSSTKVPPDNAYDEPNCEIRQLQYFQACMLATVLEDTITEFQILVECNTGMRISKTMADMTKLSAQKFGVEEPTAVDELEGIDPNELDNIEYKLKKLHADREYVNHVLVSLYKDLASQHSFGALAMYVEKALAYEDFQEFLIEDEAKNRAARRDLAKQLRQQRNQHKSITYDTDAIIEDLKTQVEDAALNAQIRSRYIENWQRSRTEQHLQTIENVESVPSQLIELYKQRTDHEQRVHSEVELFINIAINETLTKIEEWMNKYDADIENIDLKIQIQKNDYENQKDTRIELEETYVKHDQLMEEWIKFKEEREKARLYVEKMNKSAVIVQAWWRGLLVRLELGPYKPPPKKGGKKKEKKQKTKKK